MNRGSVPCYTPMVAGPVPGLTLTGKRRLKFLGKACSYSGKAPTGGLLLPCRQCIGCRLERSRQWATRLMHEASLHENACFLTLTYDDQQIPVDRSLNKSHLRTFFKDLRSRCDYYGKGKLKYFACGEYGDATKRPHYHAALFGPIGVHSPDPERHQEEPSRSGSPQYTHDSISSVWPYGLHRLSELSFESAAYVARYCLKKVSGISASAHYGDLTPEFQRQSQGLGKGHVQKWQQDIYPGDQVVLPGRGAFMPPPYYDRILEKVDPVLYEKVKQARKDAHEKMTSTEWFTHVSERYREMGVRELVTEQTLKREGVL